MFMHSPKQADNANLIKKTKPKSNTSFFLKNAHMKHDL